MSAAVSVDAMVPKISVTPKWWAEKIEPHLRALNLEGVVQVLLSVKKVMASGEEPRKVAGQSVKKKLNSVGRYLLRKGKGVWQLVFNGMETVIKDGRGIALVAEIKADLLTALKRGHRDSLAAMVGSDAADITAESWPT